MNRDAVLVRTRIFFENPQFLKRVRELVRGRRAFVIISIYTGLLALICFFALAQEVGSGREASEAGRTIFMALWITQGILIGILAFISSVGSVVSEHHGGCFPALVLTGMSPARVLAGEIASAVAFSAGLVFAGLPMMGLSFLLGGASLGEILGTEILCILGALSAATLGVLISTLSVGGNMITVVLRVVTGTALLILAHWGYFLWLMVYQSGLSSAVMATPGGPGYFYFYSMMVPGGVFGVFFSVFLIAVYFNVARRKFHSASRRAFSPTGFFLAAGVLLLLLAGSGSSAGSIGEEVYQPINVVASGLILVGVLFAAGREREEILCAGRENVVVSSLRRLRIHLFAFVLLILVINQVWWKAGALDPGAPMRLAMYHFGVLLAAQGVVNFLSPLVSTRRPLTHATIAIFIIWTTVVPTAMVVMLEGYRIMPRTGTAVCGVLLGSTPGVGAIFAADPPDMPHALRNLGGVEHWLWMAVLGVHAAVFLGGTLIGFVIQLSRGGVRAREPVVPEQAEAA
jgi:hypothetical protein